ncbi:MAG: hypothetical protein PHV34_16600 [Verrucomicrobiae bacterium]|nr:hypothetical protein [Verrucomicrobiae bacterium]
MSRTNRGRGFVGLANDPGKVKKHLGNPICWVQEGPFFTEKAARVWMQYYLDEGYTAIVEENGWRFGYRYPNMAMARK